MLLKLPPFHQRRRWWAAILSALSRMKPIPVQMTTVPSSGSDKMLSLITILPGWDGISGKDGCPGVTCESRQIVVEMLC